MKSQTETPEMFKTFKALKEKHLGELIKCSRCDNGKAEYDNSIFQAILREMGYRTNHRHHIPKSKRRKRTFESDNHGKGTDNVA